MRKLQTILLGTDFGPASREASEVAVRLASVFGSRVTLFHVVQALPTWPALLYDLSERATLQMEEFAQTIRRQQVAVQEKSIVHGHAADAIARKADEIDADLILIGAGERFADDRFSLGPVAAAVTQHATKPVLAVRPGRPALNFQTILCPVDMSEASSRGLRNADRLAAAFDSRVVVLTVIAPSWLGSGADSGRLADIARAHDQSWREEFDKFLKGRDQGDVRWEKDIRTGKAHEEIVAAAQAHAADLIVMGSTGRTGLARILMGSVTRRVIQQLPCSLLTVKQETTEEELLSESVHQIRTLFAEGKSLLESGSYEAALGKFGQVLLLDRFYAEAWDARAETYEKLGRAGDADRCRRHAELLRHERWD